MRNATIEDVKKAKETGKLEENVMYHLSIDPRIDKGRLVHGKRCIDLLALSIKSLCGYGQSIAIAETSDGFLTTVDLGCIHPLSKGPSQQPKKPRRKPKKGTRPETLVPMSEDIKLKVGDKVALSDGSRDVIECVDDHRTPYKRGEGWFWHKPNGNSINPGYAKITHVIRPYQEPAETMQGTTLLTDFLPGEISVHMGRGKCQAQKDFEKGYWVPFVATSESVCPPWAAFVEIETLLSEYHTLSSVGVPGNWYRWGDQGVKIVAYRKAKQ